MKRRGGRLNFQKTSPSIISEDYQPQSSHRNQQQSDLSHVAHDHKNKTDGFTVASVRTGNPSACVDDQDEKQTPLMTDRLYTSQNTGRSAQVRRNAVETVLKSEAGRERPARKPRTKPREWVDPPQDEKITTLPHSVGNILLQVQQDQLGKKTRNRRGNDFQATDVPSNIIASAYPNNRDRDRDRDKDRIRWDKLRIPDPQLASPRQSHTAIRHPTEPIEYLIFHELGRGTCGIVYRCWELHLPNRTPKRVVAVKVVRNHPVYAAQAQHEVKVVQALNKAASAESNNNIVRVFDSFKSGNHFCIVFEELSMNLYDVLRLRRFRGFNLQRVQWIVSQLVSGLALIHSRRWVHCDLKPENILVVTSCQAKSLIQTDHDSKCSPSAEVPLHARSCSPAASTAPYFMQCPRLSIPQEVLEHGYVCSTRLPVGDSPPTSPSSKTGSACKSEHSPAGSRDKETETTVTPRSNESSPRVASNSHSPSIQVVDFGSARGFDQLGYSYIQSRFYRAPEVLLGVSYNGAMDMWSLGCIAAELYLGLPLFPGASDFDQIRRIVDLLGYPPEWLLVHGKYASKFFKRMNVPRSKACNCSSEGSRASPFCILANSKFDNKNLHFEIGTSSELAVVLEKERHRRSCPRQDEFESQSNENENSKMLSSSTQHAAPKIKPCDWEMRAHEAAGKSETESKSCFDILAIDDLILARPGKHHPTPSHAPFGRYVESKSAIKKEQNSRVYFAVAERADILLWRDFLDLIKKLLVLDPRERITASEALQHPFVASIQSQCNAQVQADLENMANVRRQKAEIVEKWHQKAVTEMQRGVNNNGVSSNEASSSKWRDNNPEEKQAGSSPEDDIRPGWKGKVYKWHRQRHKYVGSPSRIEKEINEEKTADDGHCPRGRLASGDNQKRFRFRSASPSSGKSSPLGWSLKDPLQCGRRSNFVQSIIPTRPMRQQSATDLKTPEVTSDNSLTRLSQMRRIKAASDNESSATRKQRTEMRNQVSFAESALVNEGNISDVLVLRMNTDVTERSHTRKSTSIDNNSSLDPIPGEPIDSYPSVEFPAGRQNRLPAESAQNIPAYKLGSQYRRIRTFDDSSWIGTGSALILRSPRKMSTCVRVDLSPRQCAEDSSSNCIYETEDPMLETKTSVIFDEAAVEADASMQLTVQEAADSSWYRPESTDQNQPPISAERRSSDCVLDCCPQQTDLTYPTGSLLYAYRDEDLIQFTNEQQICSPSVEYPSEMYKADHEFQHSPPTRAPPPDPAAGEYVQSVSICFTRLNL